jgi:hypothetical protein
MKFDTRGGVVDMELGEASLSFDLDEILARPDDQWFDLLALRGSAKSTLVWTPEAETPDPDRPWLAGGGIGVTRHSPDHVSPTHIHTGLVFGYTVRGTWHYREYDWVARPGSLIYEAANSMHTYEALGAGEVIGVWYQVGPNIYVGEGGRAYLPGQQDLLEAYLAYHGGQPVAG